MIECKTLAKQASDTRLRRFVVGLIKSKGAVCVAQKIRELVQNTLLAANEAVENKFTVYRGVLPITKLSS